MKSKETTIETFKDQLVQASPVTEDILNKLKNKTFESGRPIEVGDKLLFGLIEQDKESLKLIRFHIDELDTKYRLLNNNVIPQIINI